MDYNSTTGCPFYSFFGEGIANMKSINRSVCFPAPFVRPDMSTLKGTRPRESDGDVPLSTQASRLARATMRHFDKLSASHVRPGQVNINALPVRGRVVRVEFGEGGE